MRALPEIGVVAETGCRYFREIGFPEPIEMGLVVDKVGTSSIVYRIGLFQGPADEAAAEGRFVHVYVDNSRGAGSRPVTPIPDVVREAVVRLLRSRRVSLLTATRRWPARMHAPHPGVPCWDDCSAHLGRKPHARDHRDDDHRRARRRRRGASTSPTRTAVRRCPSCRSSATRCARASTRSPRSRTPSPASDPRRVLMVGGSGAAPHGGSAAGLTCTA